MSALCVVQAQDSILSLVDVLGRGPMQGHGLPDNMCLHVSQHLLTFLSPSHPTSGLPGDEGKKIEAIHASS